MSENDNNVEKDTDSDDGFEVVDPEPDEGPQDFNYLSRTRSVGNAGTIIFCLLHDEYESISQVKCEYIRPEGWTEKEGDVVAIFEVGWMNIDEAVAKIPVNVTISQGFPIGSVNLSEFAFRKEDYSECAAVASHFQFCYLRDGIVLGASTPFTIRGIGSARRFPLLEQKPLFVPASIEHHSLAADPLISLYETTNNFSAPETAAANAKHNQDNKHFIEHEAAHDFVDGSPSVEALQSTVRNLTALTKRLQSRHLYGNDRASKYTPELILKLNKSVDELTAEMHKAAGDLPSASMTQPSSSSEELEEQFRTTAAQLKANVQDCNRTFDLCKVAIKNQTPPSSLSEHETSHLIRESEWKRQQESEQLLKLRKAEEELQQLTEEVSSKETEQLLKLREAEEELQQLKEEVSSKETEQLKKLRKAEEELQQLKEEVSSKETEQLKKLLKAEEEKQALKDVLALIEADCTELKQQLEKVGAEWKSEVSAKEELERQLKETGALLESTKEKLQLEERRCQDVQKSFYDLTNDFKIIQEELSLEDVSPHELKTQVQAAKEKMSLKEMSLMSKLDNMQKLQDMVDELTLKEINHQYYVAEAEIEKQESAALAVAHASAKSQIESLQDEAKLYKSKLGETIVELTNSRQQTDSLKEQCTKFVQDLNYLESEKERLTMCITNLREELKEKGGCSCSCSADERKDVLIREFLKKSEDLNVAKQQIANFQDELSRVNAQRTTLLKELQEAQQKPACERACCAFEITRGTHQPEQVVDSVLEALEQSHQMNRHLEKELETEKRRVQVLEDKLQNAAGKQRTLYMDKITLETRLKEFLGSK